MGLTEVINNTLSPVFTVPFTVEHDPDANQKITVAIYDSDGGKANIVKDNLLGQASARLNKLLAAKAQQVSTNQCPISLIETEDLQQLKLAMPKGSVTLTAALIDSSHMSTDVVRAQIHGYVRREALIRIATCVRSNQTTYFSRLC